MNELSQFTQCAVFAKVLKNMMTVSQRKLQKAQVISSFILDWMEDVRVECFPETVGFCYWTQSGSDTDQTLQLKDSNKNLVSSQDKT